MVNVGTVNMPYIECLGVHEGSRDSDEPIRISWFIPFMYGISYLYLHLVDFHGKSIGKCMYHTWSTLVVGGLMVKPLRPRRNGRHKSVEKATCHANDTQLVIQYRSTLHWFFQEILLLKTSEIPRNHMSSYGIYETL